MAHEDLGFVPDNPHDDIGFVPDPAPDNESIGSKVKGLLGYGNGPGTMGHALEAAKARYEIMSPEERDREMADYKRNLPEGLAVGATSLLPVPASPLARIALSAAEGAGIGGLSPSDSSDERLKKMGQGALVAGGLSTAGEGLAKGLSWLGDKLSGSAERRAFKALGPYQRQAVQNSENINDIGRTALDHGVIGKIPRGYDVLAERAGAAKDLQGQAIENAVEELSNQANAPALDKGELLKSVAQRFEGNEIVPGVSAKNDKVGTELASLWDKLPDQIPLKDARTLKQAIKGQIQWDRLPGSDVPLTEEINRGLYSELASGENKIAEGLANNGAIPNSSDFLNAKKQYGNLAIAERLASNRSNKEFANRLISPSDYGTGATAAMIAGGRAAVDPLHAAAAAGAVGTMANNISRRYGNQVLAKYGDMLGSTLSESPELIQQLVARNPAILDVLSPQPGQYQINKSSIDRRLSGRNQ